MQGEVVVAALIMRTFNGREVKLSENELREAYLRADDLEIMEDGLGNITIRLTEPLLQGEVIDDARKSIQE